MILKTGRFVHLTDYGGCEVVSWANTSLRTADTADLKSAVRHVSGPPFRSHDM